MEMVGNIGKCKFSRNFGFLLTTQIAILFQMSSSNNKVVSSGKVLQNINVHSVNFSQHRQIDAVNPELMI